MIDDLVMYRVGQTEKKLKKNERKHEFSVLEFIETILNF